MDCEELIRCHDYPEAQGGYDNIKQTETVREMRMRNKGFFVLLLNREICN